MKRLPASGSVENRAGVEYKDADQIKRVAVLTLDALVVDRRQFAQVLDFAEGSLFRLAAKALSVSARMGLFVCQQEIAAPDDGGWLSFCSAMTSGATPNRGSELAGLFCITRSATRGLRLKRRAVSFDPLRSASRATTGHREARLSVPVNSVSASSLRNLPPLWRPARSASHIEGFIRWEPCKEKSGSGPRPLRPPCGPPRRDRGATFSSASAGVFEPHSHDMIPGCKHAIGGGDELVLLLVRQRVSEAQLIVVQPKNPSTETSADCRDARRWHRHREWSPPPRLSRICS